MKKTIQLIILTTLTIYISGCSLIQLAQESKEVYKTSTSHGYQNGIKPDNIRNFKDFIVDENYFVIISEDELHTVYKSRDTSLRGKLAIITGPQEYCEDIGGKVEFGRQVGGSIALDFDSVDFEFSSAKKDYRKYKVPSYKGWMRCVNSKDDFEIKRKDRSKYFFITHKNKQLQGYSIQWFASYMDIEDIDPKHIQAGAFSYASFMQLASMCIYHKGKLSISNRYTDKKEISLDAYFLQQLDPLKNTKGYILASGFLSCKDSTDKKSDYTFDITYSKKYRTLIYTKRQ